MGSVTSAEQVAAVLDAGADFVVSPGVCAEATRVAVAAGVACYPGGFTATEILTAWELGAPAVKLFPAATGGPRHLRDLRGPLPGIPLIPTGGVAIEQIGEYLAAGAAAVGLGGPLIGDALGGGSLDALRERAGAALGAVREARARRWRSGWAARSPTWPSASAGWECPPPGSAGSGTIRPDGSSGANYKPRGSTSWRSTTRRRQD